MQSSILQGYSKLVRGIVAAAAIFLHVIGLVLPYSSTYFVKEWPSSSQNDTSSTVEKVRTSSALYSSPVLTALPSTLNIIHVPDEHLYRLIEYDIASRLNVLLVGRTSRDLDTSACALLPWHPSIVIALRKLLI